MKKTIKIFLLLASLFASEAQGQTWDEIFNQRKTQTKYLLEQVAALRVYIDHVQKTYRIAKEGLDFIGKASKGEFDLHDNFFNSLSHINPEVRKYKRVADIMVLQSQIINTYKRSHRVLQEKQTLWHEEMEYVGTVHQRILHDCVKILEELSAVTTSGKFEMKDDERIARINSLYQQMQQNYRITESFGAGAVQLAIARERQKTAIANSRILNQVNK